MTPREETEQILAEWFGFDVEPDERVALAERLHERDHETILRLRAVPEKWDAASRDWYYDNRHTHPNGIDFAAGFEEGWDHAGRLLAAILAAAPFDQGDVQ